MKSVRNFSCGGCTLRIGTIITGIISLIFSMCFFIAIMTKVPDPRPSQRVRRNIYIALVILAAATIIASLFLIIGAKNARKKLLIPWIAVTIINFILAIVFVVHMLTVIGSDPKGLEAVAATLILIGMVLTACLLTVVCSHYKELKKRKKEESAKREEDQIPSPSS